MVRRIIAQTAVQTAAGLLGRTGIINQTTYDPQKNSSRTVPTTRMIRGIKEVYKAFQPTKSPLQSERYPTKTQKPNQQTNGFTR